MFIIVISPSNYQDEHMGFTTYNILLKKTTWGYLGLQMDIPWLQSPNSWDIT
jgi:hypothetical protein